MVSLLFYRGSFAKNTVLKSLNLGFNKLKKIDTNMFRGLRLLRRLLLNDNEIEHVERGMFDAISRIGVIDLSGNKIKKIDYQMFNELRYVEVNRTILLFCPNLKGTFVTRRLIYISVDRCITQSGDQNRETCVQESLLSAYQFIA